MYDVSYSVFLVIVIFICKSREPLQLLYCHLKFANLNIYSIPKSPLRFSDAARTIVVARGDCQYNIDGDQYVADEFCSDNLLDVIIRMYSGDYDYVFFLYL